MNDKKGPNTPDFEVSWQQRSTLGSEIVDIERLKHSDKLDAGGLRNAVASLHTDNVYIEVSDLNWPQAVSLEFTPNRMGFTSVIALSSGVRYGHHRDDLSVNCMMGTSLFLHPGTTIFAEFSPGRLCTVTCSFDDDYVKTFVGNLDGINAEKIQQSLSIRNQVISSLLQRLSQEAVHKTELSQNVADSFGQAILVEFAHWLNTTAEVEKSGVAITADHFSFIEHYLSDRAGQPPKIADIAKACGYSERYFAKRFRDQVGLSPSQFIKSVRISKAKNLLSETELSLKEIAFRLGYSGTSNFSAAFSAAAGITPGQFRDGGDKSS